jgi:VanZ family protein
VDTLPGETSANAQDRCAIVFAKGRWPERGTMTITSTLKACCAAALGVLVFFGLGPAHLQPRSGLGWQVDHFVGYIVLSFVFCIAWARPLVIAGALAFFAVLLEALQALTTDRSSNAEAAFYSVCGVLAGALIAEVSMRAWRRFQSNRAKTQV